MGRLPISNLCDDVCEELAFLYLFCSGEFRYQIDRELKRTSVKYFSQGILNYIKLFAADLHYILLPVTQQLKLQN